MTNNDRYVRMDNFLKNFRDMYVANPNLDDIGLKNSAYYNLVRLGVKPEDKKINLSTNGVFERFINKFYSRNTNCFVDPNWSYFCQFTNRKSEFLGETDEIKIYIPQDADHIEKSVEMIFNYLDDKDIPHISKVAKLIRFDDVVVRLKNENDARDLLKFIENNSYIQEGLIKSNPFAFSSNNIAMVCDGRLSYNSVLADTFCAYMRDCKEKNTLDRVSLENYVSFLGQYYNDHFIDHKNLDDVVGDIELIDNTEDDNNYKLVNVKYIIALFLKGIDPNFNLNQYFNEYNARCDISKINRETNDFREARNPNNYKKLNETEEFLMNAVYIIMEKNREEDTEPKDDKYYERVALNSIYKYLYADESVRDKYLTRTNNLRGSAHEFGFRDKLISELDKENVDLFRFYNNTKAKKQKIDLDNAIRETYNKYEDRYEQGFETIDGKEWCVRAIEMLMNNGVYNGFTKTNNARFDLMKFTKPIDVRYTLEGHLNHRLESRQDLFDYVDDVINSYSRNLNAK